MQSYQKGGILKKILATTSLSGLLLGTCVSVATAEDIVIGVPNWPSVAVTANVLKVVIEDNLGLTVELQNGTNPIIFEAMDGGSMHIHPEVWIPNQKNLHDTYVTEKGTVLAGENGVEAFIGMCLPRGFAEANNISSIDDLTNPNVAALFDSNGDGKGEIYIGATGWASTNVERIRAKTYGYGDGFELQEMDEALAYADLDNAISNGTAWVGACYAPHYVFAQYDLTVLEEPAHDPAQWNVSQPTDDPKWLENSTAGVGWDSAYLYPYYSKSLADEHPAVASLVANMKLDSDTVSAMTLAVAVEKADPAEYAKKWVSENEDRVLDWLSN